VSVLGIGLALLLVIGAPATAGAVPLSLGWLTFDQFIPADTSDPTSIGLNAFNIFNATGPYALLDPLTTALFLNASLQLNGDTPVAIGTINPGPLDDGFGSPLFALQFPDTLTITSAVFTATLNTSTFLLTDGSTFQASSPDLLFTLSSPGGLVPNGLSDVFTGVEFLVEGDVTPPDTSVPEPSTLLLLAGGLGVALRSAMRRRAQEKDA